MAQRKITDFNNFLSRRAPPKIMTENIESTCKRKAILGSEGDEIAGPLPKIYKKEYLHNGTDEETKCELSETNEMVADVPSPPDDSNVLIKRNDENKPVTKFQSTLCFKGIDDVQKEITAMALRLLVIDTKIEPSWFQALKPEFKKLYFEKLNNFVIGERERAQVYPPPEKVWSWTKECSLEDIKVVILGQDPYHNPGQAHGLCFSVLPPTPPPPSLINMYKELSTDIEGFTIPKHGNLVGWARQGVLLLNACLTVRKNVPNSHKDHGWENLTTGVIKYLNEHKTGIVFLLWGSYAQKKADFVNKKKHCIMKTVHPSPLSASRGWFGCKHFSKCNDYLKRVNKKPINWSELPEK